MTNDECILAPRSEHGSVTRSNGCCNRMRRATKKARLAPFVIRHSSLLLLALTVWLLTITAVSAQNIPVLETLGCLTSQEDTDHDQKITVHDRTTPFIIRDNHGAAVRTLTNFYQMSVLLQGLARAEAQYSNTVSMDNLQLDESAVDRTHRFIKEYFWNALTRRVDEQYLDQVLSDSKTSGRYDYIYVPAADTIALKYFTDLANSKTGRYRSPALKVVALPSPDKITGAYVRNLDGEHGLMSLKMVLNAQGEPVSGVPYVVPGGRFNELYGWDSYFIVLGLLQDGRTDLARDMADNLLYEVQYYGKVCNANRTYYLTRSQPPFLTGIVRAVFESGKPNKTWLAAALNTMLAEY
jgi:alpha,alpha-trehalase